VKPLRLSLAFAALLTATTPATAAELFGGLYAHDVDIVTNNAGFESGADVQAGWRGGRLRALHGIGAPSPYVFASISTSGDTNMAAAGLSWKIGDRFFLRPGIGLAVHDRPSHVIFGPFRADLGSRILFEPELGIGFRISDRVTAEASWIHVSHAGLFSRQNPGMDNVGVRIGFQLP
jgi:hypothetical protein